MLEKKGEDGGGSGGYWLRFAAVRRRKKEETKEGLFVVVELGKKMAGPMVISGELGLGSCLVEWLFQLHFEGRFWIYFVDGVVRVFWSFGRLAVSVKKRPWIPDGFLDMEEKEKWKVGWLPTPSQKYEEKLLGFFLFWKVFIPSLKILSTP